MDTEKVIKGLENCLHYKGHCLDCPYNSPNCQNDVLNDAIAILTEQKAKPDKCIICEGCGHKLQDDWNWCPWCRRETARGRSVKLE